jgi:hypothetical protein
MFIKNGDLNPITIIEPKNDIDDATKVALKKAIKSVKDKQKDIKEVK